MSYVRAGKLLKVKKAKDKRQEQNNKKILIKKMLLAEDYYNCIGYKYNR